MSEAQLLTSDMLYCLGCCLADIGKADDALIERMCNEAGIPYPPQRLETE